MLERTRTRFTGQSDEPCSGAARLAPTDLEDGPRHSAGSGASPLLPASLGVVSRSLRGSGASLPTSATSEADPWPPPAERGTCMSGAPPPQITKDWKRRGATLAFAPCGVLGADAGIVDLALGGRLFRESASRRSEPSKRWQDASSCSTGFLGGSSWRGASLRPSETPGPPGPMQERVTR
jgi:hypothetical protein